MPRNAIGSLALRNAICIYVAGLIGRISIVQLPPQVRRQCVARLWLPL